MAENRFAKYAEVPAEAPVASASNRFAKYAEAPAPTGSPTLKQVLSKTIENLTPRTDYTAEDYKHALGRTARGVAQAAGSFVTIPGNALNKTINALTGSNLRMPGDMLDEQLNKVTPQSQNGLEDFTEGMAKSAAVNMLPVSLGAQVTGNALTGFANARPGNEALETTVGAAVPSVLYLGGKAITGVRNLMQGAKPQAIQYLDDVITRSGAGRNEVLNALDDTQPMYRGEQPTAGMAAVGDGRQLPFLKQLQNNAEQGQFAANEFGNIERINSENFLRPLHEMAAPGTRPPTGFGQPQNPSPAGAAKSAMTAPLYEASNKDLVPLTRELQVLLHGPEVSPSIKRGAKAYSQETINSALGGRAIPRGGSKTHVTVEKLRNISQDLKKQINAINPAADSTGKRARLLEARDQLEGMIESASPTYASAKSAYREASIPQNTADIAKVLINKVQDASGEDTYGSFLTAMRDEPGTIKAAGLGKYYKELGQVVPEGQLDEIRKLESAALRKQAYERLGANQNAIGDRFISTAGEVEQKIPTLLNQKIAMLRKGLKLIGRNTAEDAQQVIDMAMTDPGKLAALLRSKGSYDMVGMRKAIKYLEENKAGNTVANTLIQALRSAGGGEDATQ